MKRKLLLLFAIMAIGLSSVWAYDFSAVAPSGQTLYYNIVSGNAEVSAYPGLSGALEIPSTVTYNGTTYSVTSIGAGAFYGCNGLTGVTIPNSVTTIGECAFDGCNGLTSVTIGNSVTSIGDYAFQRCSGLTSVIIPNSVRSIGVQSFFGCSGLTNVTIGNSVTSIGDFAFNRCSGLTSVTIPNSVDSIGGGAFEGCSGLTSVTIGNSVTTIEYQAFADCTSLTSVTIPNSVTSIGNVAFADCTSLTSVTIPYSVTSIGVGAFAGCSGLTSVTIGNSVTSIGDGAFYGCSGLTSVTMEGATPPTLGSDVFYRDASNRKIYVPCGAYENYYNANNGWSYYRNDLSDPIVDIDVALATEAERGSVNIIPLRDQEVRCDSTVVVCATANYGYHFDHWSTGSTQAQDTIAISGDTVITAYFESDAPTQYTITVVSNDSNMGTVTGSGSYDDGEVTTITATANEGYHFVRWNDNDTNADRTVIVTANATYTAYFAADQSNGINEISGNVAISVRGNSIFVSNAQERPLRIFDIQGRMIVSEKAVEGKQYLVPRTGVYMVQIGNYPAQKVVVVR